MLQDRTRKRLQMTRVWGQKRERKLVCPQFLITCSTAGVGLGYFIMWVKPMSTIVGGQREEGWVQLQECISATPGVLNNEQAALWMLHKVSRQVFSTWIETIRKGLRKKDSSEGHQADCAKAHHSINRWLCSVTKHQCIIVLECEWLAQPVTGIAIPRARDWRLCRAFILPAVLVVRVPGMGTKCAVAVGCSPHLPLSN